MLYKLHTNIIVIGFLTIGIMASIVIEKALCMMTLVPLLSFISNLFLLLYYSREEHTDYSEKSLFITVLLYTFFMGVFFMLISMYYDDDTFELSKIDAMFYYRNSMKVTQLGLANTIQYIIGKYKTDDWGALLFDSVMMSIIPSKFFLNAIYTLLGSISSVLLYRIGKSFMPEKYAYLASLGYSISSYMVFFNCSFLKETLFVFLVISVIYHQHNAIFHKTNKSLIAVALFIFFIFFFRPAVSAFLAASIFVYYCITQKHNAISLFLYIAAAGALLASMTMIQEIFDRNTAGGDLDAVIDETNNGAYSGGFNLFVSIFGAFFGPFPSIYSSLSGPTYLEYLAGGLIYKLFLVIPFWFGVYQVFKNKVIALFPMTIFVLIELLITGLIMASLELRKVVLHIPFMFLLSFYGMYKGFIPCHLNRVTHTVCYILAIGIMFLWNVIKVKN